ncbi:hypothetical protein MNBD_ACTINO01-1245 [hydrothermal vent metagenome]|uniref:Methyltransferase type 11 domain-containing protein n=1 Tax=hydrothermal vent metagenome TaxID=652676 RepID=A0A3B0SJD7_9ZZZZ
MLEESPARFFAAIGELEWYSRTHRHWIDDLGLRVRDRVLEVGCATGTLTAYLADNGYRVTGFDRSNAMIRQARNDHPDMDFSVGDATRLPYGDDTFDAVVAASVINVVSDGESVLSEMHRVCAPGGTVSILVPSTDFTDDGFDALIESLGLEGFSRAALTKWHRSATKMSRSQLATLLASAGFGPAVTHSYLDGMIIAPTVTVQRDRIAP